VTAKSVASSARQRERVRTCSGAWPLRRSDPRLAGEVAPLIGPARSTVAPLHAPTGGRRDDRQPNLSACQPGTVAEPGDDDQHRITTTICSPARPESVRRPVSASRPYGPCGVDLRSSLDPNTSTRRAHQPGGRPPGNGQNQTPASRLDQPRSFRDDLQEQPSAGPTLSIFVHGQTGELDSLAFLQDSQWP
jgi:hypothetical protein